MIGKRTVRPRVRMRIRTRGMTRRRQWIVGGLTAAVLLGSTSALALRFQEQTVPCAVAIAGDRSLSSDDEVLVQERIGEAEAFVDARSSCESVFVESINARPGQSVSWQGPLRGHGSNPLDTERSTKANLAEVHRQIEKIFSSPPTSGTNIVWWFRDAGSSVRVPPGGVVYAALYTDGLNTIAPANLMERTTPSRIADMLRTLEPLPELKGWHIRFVTVDRTARGAVSEQVAQGARAFWIVFVRATHGSLEGYAPVS
jgi:hypothetical protein